MDTQEMIRFADLLAECASAGKAAQEASKQVDAEEAEALTGLLQRIKPILRYIDEPIQDGEWSDGQQFHDADKANAPFRGVLLIDRERKVYTDRDDRGHWDGDALALVGRRLVGEAAKAFIPGEFAIAHYAGDWSHWQGESSDWRRIFEPATAGEALRMYSFDEIVDALLAALRKASDASRTKQVKLEKRMEKLAAVREALK